MSERITKAYVLQFYPDNTKDTRLISVYSSYSNADDAVIAHSKALGTALDTSMSDMGVIESYSQDGKLFGSYEITEMRLNAPLPKDQNE